MVKKLSDGVTETQILQISLKEIVHWAENYLHDNGVRALL